MGNDKKSSWGGDAQKRAEALQKGVNKAPEWASKAWAAVKGTVMPKAKADSNDKRYK